MRVGNDAIVAAQHGDIGAAEAILRRLWGTVAKEEPPPPPAGSAPRRAPSRSEEADYAAAQAELEACLSGPLAPPPPAQSPAPAARGAEAPRRGMTTTPTWIASSHGTAFKRTSTTTRPARASPR